MSKGREILTEIDKPWRPFIASLDNEVAKAIVEDKEVNEHILAHLLIENFDDAHALVKLYA